MDVGVNQAWKEGAIAQVYYLSAARMLHRSSELDDAFILDQDFCRLEHAPGPHVEETGCVQNDWMGRSGLRLGRGIGGENQ
jgi:hypothetical protein